MRQYLFLFAILAIVFTSCQKNEVEVKAETLKWVEFQNNEQLVSVLNQLDNGKAVSEK